MSIRDYHLKKTHTYEEYLNIRDVLRKRYQSHGEDFPVPEFEPIWDEYKIQLSKSSNEKIRRLSKIKLPLTYKSGYIALFDLLHKLDIILGDSRVFNTEDRNTPVDFLSYNLFVLPMSRELVALELVEPSFFGFGFIHLTTNKIWADGGMMFPGEYVIHDLIHIGDIHLGGNAIAKTRDIDPDKMRLNGFKEYHQVRQIARDSVSKNENLKTTEKLVRFILFHIIHEEGWFFDIKYGREYLHEYPTIINRIFSGFISTPFEKTSEIELADAINFLRHILGMKPLIERNKFQWQASDIFTGNIFDADYIGERKLEILRKELLEIGMDSRTPRDILILEIARFRMNL